ncbi:MAG TPA: hypothetical protein VN436_02305 [Holophaga sp.]|nr:hypothetical protein [Holophaga sp.]
MAQPCKFPEPWLTLTIECGGVNALASALGTTRRGVAFWAHSQRIPRGAARVAILALFKAKGVEPPAKLKEEK